MGSFSAQFVFKEFWVDKDRFFTVTVFNNSKKQFEESQKLHEIILNDVKDGIIGIDLNGNITFVNSRGASLLGYKVNELKGRSFYSTIYHLNSDEDIFRDSSNIVYSAIRDGESKTGSDQVFLSKYGSFISVDLKASPIKEDDETMGVVITFKNNQLSIDTDLRMNIFFGMSNVVSRSLGWEETIEQTLQIIGENLQWELANYWEINPAQTTLECLCQWKASYLKSKAISKFQDISKSMVFIKGEGLPGEVWEKGKPVWISEIPREKNFPREPFGVKAGLRSGFASPVYAGDQIIGVFEFFSSVFQDHLDSNQIPLLVGLGGQLGLLKKRMESEKNLIVAKEMAVKADNYKSEFLSQMSHELRTPLNAIIGFAQILLQSKRPVLDEKHVSDVKLILESGRHLLRLINEILDLSRIESGKMSVKIESINLNKLVTETIASIRPMAQKANITLIDFMTGSNEVYVLADEFRLRQVFLNLVANGIKYNKPCGSVTLNHEIKNNDYVRINVQDTGKGIPESFQSKIFKPFERGGAEFSQIEGTGIGLSVTKKLVELMNGYIDFHSIEHEGTCFYVDIPLAPIAKEPMVFSGKPSKNISSLSINLKKPINVLYVEDNIRNLKLVKRIIEEQNGINLYCAQDGMSGLEAAKINLPDLILLDIHLPKMNGFDVFMQLKKIKATKSIPVIAVSANASDEDINKAKGMGFKDYLTKPLNVNSLLEVLNKYEIYLK